MAGRAARLGAQLRQAWSRFQALTHATWFRWVMGIAFLIGAVVLISTNEDFIAEAWHTLLAADFTWIGISVAALAVSFFAMAEVMRLLFRAAGVNQATVRSTNSLVLASNAWSVTVPGGVAFATALQIRRQLAWGASPVVVSWFMVFSGALSTLGLTALAILSLFFIGNNPAPVRLIASFAAVLALTTLLWWLSRKPRVIRFAALRCLEAFNRLRRRDRRAGQRRVEDMISQLTEVELSLDRMLVVLAWSLFNWLADVVCLYAAIRAIGVDDMSSTAVLLAFVTGKVAGFIQATPGGVGPVEAVLTTTLVAAGMVATQAFAAIIVYRTISFVLPAAVGWLIFLINFGDESPQRGRYSMDSTRAGGGSYAANQPSSKE
ncbi:YbhN family protein [Corynebacterium sp. TAE3-ERU12]|uniref:lysylphosphatidylglycerol synthase transmembrane domain-containing protein n=1 Tax=Corynebacterium sp. TAE3-ERU12 TaxID=2849491 RepID=UPI001C492C71|nr:YbhN family protein [Corynebacterium sp. TAE3-ERU12]MBV7296059.1 YbhN family protein [Corynebacterium sp. TAE3-ERU12]